MIEPNQRSIYRFYDVEADHNRFQLVRGGVPLELEPKSLRLLFYLIEHRDRVVGKEELIREVWKGSFVTDNAVTRAVVLVRKMLQDDAKEPRYIETVPTVGYRFIAELTPEAVPEKDPRMPTAQKPKSGLQSGWRLAALCGGIAAVVAAGLVLFPHRKPALTEQDTIVLADFSNSTADPVFNDTLRQALAIQLEQSPFLKIMDDEQANQTLRLMSLQRGTHITDQIAHEICVRDGAAATIDGSIAGLGTSYIVTLTATTCQSGATVAREQSHADDKEHVLHALETAATAMRARLGESRSSIQKLNRPLEQVTSGSLEALQNYSAGHALLAEGRFLAARPLFERAIALDPNFAMAYFYLSIAYDNAGDTQRGAEYERKAFALIDRVSEKERVYIASGYYDSTGELDKGIDVYRLGIATYPRVWGFHNDLSDVYIDLGEFEEGLREGQVANLLQPDVEPPYRRLMDAYMGLDQLGEAKKVAERVRAQNIGGARVHQRILELAFIEDDEASEASEIRWFAGKPEEYLSFGLQAAYRNVHGQLRESARLYNRATVSASRQDLKDLVAQFEEADAQAEAMSGDCSAAHRLGRPALALAFCGDTVGAERLIAETSKRLPNGLIWNTVQMPAIRAALELRHDHPDRAVELLTAAVPYERAYPEVVYLRGTAYLHLRKGSEAADEFRKITDHRGLSWASSWRHPNWGLYYSSSFLGLAEALTLAGESARAKKAFEDYFALWKDADHDIPVLMQAKAEYAKLK